MKLRSVWAAIRSAVSWHQRKLAAVAAVVAVLASLSVVQPPASPTVRVAIATKALSGGSPVSDADLAWVAFPAELAPEGALSSIPPGAVLAGPVTPRTVLTTASLSGGALARPGHVIVPFSLPDRALASVVAVGSRLDLIGPEGPLVTGALVTWTSAETRDNGLLGGTTGDARLLLLEVTSADAAALAKARNSSEITVAVA